MEIWWLRGVWLIEFVACCEFKFACGVCGESYAGETDRLIWYVFVDDVNCVGWYSGSSDE